MAPQYTKKKVVVLRRTQKVHAAADYALCKSDVIEFLQRIPKQKIFDLIITSPPYNLGKEYERRDTLEKYLEWKTAVIRQVIPRLKTSGSVCWQVGNYVEDGHIEPLDVYVHSIFRNMGLKLRNRIIWHFGHGLHCKRRFSGRYEVVLWYTKSDEYVFRLDAVRIPSKYPGKRHYKGPKAGKLSSHPNGKNPEDVWDLPNVKANHCEKTSHPCQFPVGLAERLVLALTNKGGLVFDPFCGVGSAGVAAAIHKRRFWGCDLSSDYLKVAQQRIEQALAGKARYRPHDRPIYDHTNSNLSRKTEK